MSNTQNKDQWDDAQLVAQLQQGNEAAFSVLIRRYQSRLFKVALGITGDAQESQDVLQDVKVFAVNDEVGTGPDDEGRTGRTATISLVVTPKQAAKVALASEMGKVRLFLRSPEDEEKLANISAKPSELLGSDEGSDREKEKLVQILR